jgi:hypothetical protein
MWHIERTMHASATAHVMRDAVNERDGAGGVGLRIERNNLPTLRADPKDQGSTIGASAAPCLHLAAPAAAAYYTRPENVSAVATTLSLDHLCGFCHLLSL